MIHIDETKGQVKINATIIENECAPTYTVIADVYNFTQSFNLTSLIQQTFETLFS